MSDAYDYFVRNNSNDGKVELSLLLRHSKVSNYHNPLDIFHSLSLYLSDRDMILIRFKSTVYTLFIGYNEDLARQCSSKLHN